MDSLSICSSVTSRPGWVVGLVQLRPDGQAAVRGRPADQVHNHS